MRKQPSIAIFSVATNIYFDYWKNMVISADKYLFNQNAKHFHVFTDRQVDVNFEKGLSNKSKIHVHKISNLQWPLATLNRYKLISEIGPKIDNQVFMHLDADMIVVPNQDQDLGRFLKKKHISLIRHPGYWRVQFPNRFKFYINFPKFFVKDIILLLKFGGLGTWSRDGKSRAFVQRKNRSKYFCGAVWFGEKAEILKFVKELSTITDIDLDRGSIPAWNDESYLNYWATKNSFVELEPKFCYAEDYANLIYLNPTIIAINKTKNKELRINE